MGPSREPGPAGGRDLAAPLRVTVTENGSVLVERDGPSVVSRGGRQESTERLRLALCRCGESSSKPYCDMTHLKVGFVGARTELAPVRVVETVDQEVGVKITSMENGPNKLEADPGGWRVQRDGVEEVLERPAIFLCRCGHSENKPFCDGTHNKIGFTAPLVEIAIVG
jgi:CDGSH-type Zn-finger protein